MNTNACVALRNVDIFQGKSLILSDVNFEVNKGEFVYMIGKTGSGAHVEFMSRRLEQRGINALLDQRMGEQEMVAVGSH